MPKEKEMVFILRSIKIVLGDDKRRGLKPRNKWQARKKCCKLPRRREEKVEIEIGIKKG